MNKSNLSAEVIFDSELHGVLIQETHSHHSEETWKIFFLTAHYFILFVALSLVKVVPRMLSCCEEISK